MRFCRAVGLDKNMPQSAHHGDLPCSLYRSPTYLGFLRTTVRSSCSESCSMSSCSINYWLCPLRLYSMASAPMQGLLTAFS